jgi:hypothetical protein
MTERAKDAMGGIAPLARIPSFRTFRIEAPAAGSAIPHYFRTPSSELRTNSELRIPHSEFGSGRP